VRVDAVGIETYKSLYSLVLRPGNLTVLAGPNNAGKSNLADALDFIAEVHRFGIDLAMRRKGGYENVAHRRVRRSKRPIAFMVRATLSDFEWMDSDSDPRPSGARVELEHSFSLRAATQAVGADYAIEDEALTIRSDGRDIVAVRRSKTELLLALPQPQSDSAQDLAAAPEDTDYPFQDPSFHQVLKQETESGNLLLRTLAFNPVVATFVNQMSRIRVYQLTPLEARRPGVPTPNAELDRHGANLPGLVASMRRDDPSAWEAVVQAMRRVLPDLTRIDIAFTHDRRLTLNFFERGVGRPWTVEEVSDGTIQSLALFAALHDFRTPLLVIEEPENSIHPWILREFVDVCRSLSNKQVLITTHSPVLLSYVRPENVAVMWKENGISRVADLAEIDPDAVATWESGKSTVFELLDSGLIPQSVPAQLPLELTTGESGPEG